jgi:ribosomal-protein-alanine N-acetyltransferase
VKLRPATREDAAALAAVHAQAFDAPWPPEAFTSLFDTPGVYALAAIDDGMIGLILMRVIAGEAEVLTLAVAGGHRRRGVARALLAAGLGLAESQNTDVAFLEVAADNAAAIALYEAAGCVAAGRRAGYYARAQGPAVDALVLRRALNSAGANVYPEAD